MLKEANKAFAAQNFPEAGKLYEKLLAKMLEDGVKGPERLLALQRLTEISELFLDNSGKAADWLDLLAEESVPSEAVPILLRLLLLQTDKNDVDGALKTWERLNALPQSAPPCRAVTGVRLAFLLQKKDRTEDALRILTDCLEKTWEESAKKLCRLTRESILGTTGKPENSADNAVKSLEPTSTVTISPPLVPTKPVNTIP